MMMFTHRNWGSVGRMPLPDVKRLYNYYKVNGAVGIWILVKHCSLEFHWSVVFRYAIERISPLVYYN